MKIPKALSYLHKKDFEGPSFKIAGVEYTKHRGDREGQVPRG